MALTIVFTAFLFFPVPGMKGAYVHMGDTIVFLCAYFLGGWYGAAVGGLGGVIADLIVAPFYAPATLIIKGLMGLTAGLLFKKAKTPLERVLAMVLPGLIMAVGYYVYEVLNYGNPIGILVASMPFNLLQAGASILAASICIPLLEKSALIRRLYK